MVLRYSHLGLTLGIIFAGFPLAGYWADRRCDSLPLFTILGAILGFAAGMVHVFKKVGPLGKRIEE